MSRPARADHRFKRCLGVEVCGECGLQSDGKRYRRVLESGKAEEWRKTPYACVKAAAPAPLRDSSGSTFVQHETKTVTATQWVDVEEGYEGPVEYVDPTQGSEADGPLPNGNAIRASGATAGVDPNAGDGGADVDPNGG